METAVEQRVDRPSSSVGPVVIGSGGALALAGSLLTWASVRLGGGLGGAAQRGQGRFGDGARGGASFSVGGLDTSAGRAVLALSVALILVALLAFAAYWFWLRLGAISAALVLGVIALVWSAVDLASPAGVFGVAEVRLARRGIPVSAGPGVYLAVIGAALAVVGAGAWLVMNRSSWAGVGATRAPATPPRGSRPDEQATTQLPPTTRPGLASD